MFLSSTSSVLFVVSVNTSNLFCVVSSVSGGLQISVGVLSGPKVPESPKRFRPMSSVLSVLLGQFRE